MTTVPTSTLEEPSRPWGWPDRAGAFLLQQSAYHAGPLGSSLPALSVLEPVTGTLLGLLAFREGASATVSPGLLLIAILLMLWGVQRLARSDLVTGSRPDPAQA